MAEKNYMTTNSLLDRQSEVRRTNNFMVHIQDITTENNGLDLVIQKAFLPQVQLRVLEVRHGNDAKKLAGVATWSGGVITILDTLNRDELDQIIAWFNQTYDSETGQIGIADNYKKDGYIAEYASNGKFMRKWLVNGMWISKLDLGTLDSASGELKEISFTIEIDPPAGGFAPEYGEEYNN